MRSDKHKTCSILALILLLAGCCGTHGGRCPSTVDLRPSFPIGSVGTQVLTGYTPPEYSAAASPVEQYCCNSGRIVDWLLADTAQHGFVGRIGAVCSDGTVLPFVTYGFNGSTSCNVRLQKSTTIRNPSDNAFTYSSGSILDAFLSGGMPNSRVSNLFGCPLDEVAVGFRAASRCYGLAAFQVACANPRDTRAPPATPVIRPPPPPPPRSPPPRSPPRTPPPRSPPSPYPYYISSPPRFPAPISPPVYQSPPSTQTTPPSPQIPPPSPPPPSPPPISDSPPFNAYVPPSGSPPPGLVG